MSEHRAHIQWERLSEGFAYADYNREHLWTFPGGVQVRASAAPAYHGLPDCVDPEQAFVASISSCHMLTLLAICSRKRHVVERYQDHAVGFLERNAEGALAVTRVALSPRIEFGGPAPDAATLNRIHELAHKECFIANSVRTDIVVRTDL